MLYIFRPAFFPDIMNILHSLGSDSLLENFATSKISLMEFLTLTDNRLEDLGAIYPFQRNRIMYGLRQFHQKPWSPESLKIFNASDTTFELFYILAGFLKQMLILECTLIYVSRNEFRHTKTTNKHIERITDELEIITSHLKTIRCITEKVSPLDKELGFICNKWSNIYRFNRRQFILHFWFLEIAWHQSHRTP